MDHPELDVVTFGKDLRRSLEDYLLSTNPIADSEPELRDRLQVLVKEGDFCKPPFVHALPVYRPGASVEALATGGPAPALHTRLRAFGLDPSRPLYEHQVQALRLAQEGRNLAVATGTGSGKTEAFLLPILDDICRHPGGGVRAILIYPLNALANDQLDRLRQDLRSFPEITFGRYTGETPDGPKDDPGVEDTEPLPNERRTRSDIRGNPPHILITNFAMLEYLLLRPWDRTLFHGSSLRFLVLDEAHSYRGAQAIEIGLLMRRVRAAVPDARLQFILTSATLGDGDQAVAGFAQALTGQPFTPRAVIRGVAYEPFTDLATPGPTLADVTRIVPDDAALTRWIAALRDPDELSALVRASTLPTAPAAAAAQPNVGRMLDLLLRPLARARKLHALSTKCARSSGDLAAELWGSSGDDAVRATYWLLVLGAGARPRGPDQPPLIPARMHYLLRGYSGASVCLFDGCPARADHPHTHWSDFVLEDRTHCEHCGSVMLPLATCVHCGLPFVVVGSRQGHWAQHAEPTDGALSLLWQDPCSDEEDDSAPERAAERRALWLCLAEGCQRLSEGDGPEACCASPRPVRLWRAADAEVKTCPACGGAAAPFPSVARRFLTSDDAATAVVAEALVRQQPARDNGRPAGGRALLTFSDSRQRAAFFVPYLGRTSAESAIRSEIWATLQELARAGEDPADFDRVVERYARRVAARGYQAVRTFDEETDDEYFDVVSLRSRGPAFARRAARTTAAVTLLEEACGSPWRRQRLLGACLAAPLVDLSADDIEAFAAGCPEFVDLPGGADGVEAALQALLGFFPRWTAVSFPDGTHPRQVLHAPVRGVYVSRGESGGRGGVRVRRWNPYHGRPQDLGRSALLRTVAVMTGRDRFRDASALRDLLDRAWEVFTDEGILDRPGPDPYYQLRHERICFTASRPFVRCARCGAATAAPFGERCLICGAPALRAVRRDDVPRHRRARYENEPLPLVVREHTAQIGSKTGESYQSQFKAGEVNVLSSSTTFELGIDIGQLKVVLLRNVPPGASQYVQRAGRAGRRAEGAAFVATYARGIPHEQHHYHAPEAFIEGGVRTPLLDMSNPILAQRHVQSFLLGRFLEQQSLAPGRLSVRNFFPPEGASADAAEAWMRRRAPALDVDVRSFLPPQCLLDASAAVIAAADALAKAAAGVTDRLGEFARESASLRAELTVRDARVSGASLGRSLDVLSHAEQDFLDQDLIGYLSAEHWLPGYAFPQDVVRLEVRQPSASKLRLERDREYGITEYAPGSEVVADGKVLRSGAVRLTRSGVLEVRPYRICRQCKRIDIGETVASHVKARCDCGQPARVSNFIEPRGFSTMVDEPVGRPNVFRQAPPPNDEVRQLQGADTFPPHPQLPTIRCGLSDNGRMFVANVGQREAGFRLCRQCGTLPGPSAASHPTPWGGRCSGQTVTVHLAHVFDTHTLELRFPEPSTPPVTDTTFWFTLTTAFLLGASQALGIEPLDLGATYRAFDDALHGQLVLYDRVSGGAGYTRAVHEELPRVLTTTWDRLAHCPNLRCDPNGSCYSCLRSNRNQFQWDRLRRGPVADWLARFVP